jgi:Leucine-rich repeat (LRR) protein
MGPLENLERLFLAKCAITDVGLKSVARYPRLRSINLYGTSITSAGLEVLAELRELRTLLITDLKLSPAAVESLKSRLPQLTVSDYTPV